MEERKKTNNILVLILSVLLVISSGIIGYLLGVNSVKNNNNTQENISEENDKNEEEKTIEPVVYTPKCNDSLIKELSLITDINDTKYNNIVEYINEQKNIEISVNYCDENSEKIIDGVAHFDLSEYKLTESQIKNTLNEFTTKNHLILNGGVGGGACVPTVYIRYERNNNNYEIKYWGALMASNDGNIYKIVDKSITSVESQEYCHYFVEELQSTTNKILEYVK